MASSLLKLDSETERVTVSMGQGGNGVIMFGKGADVPTPLHGLEAALSGCIGLTLLPLVKNREDRVAIDSVLYSVRIGDNEIKITCSCIDELRNIFSEAVASCFLSRVVALPHRIEFVQNRSTRRKKGAIRPEILQNHFYSAKEQSIFNDVRISAD